MVWEEFADKQTHKQTYIYTDKLREIIIWIVLFTIFFDTLKAILAYSRYFLSRNISDTRPRSMCLVSVPALPCVAPYN